MLNFLKRIGSSLGISQNAARIQLHLQNELNGQARAIEQIISRSTRGVAVGLAAVIAAGFALVLSSVLAYELLLPHVGNLGALAIEAGFFALCAVALALQSLQVFRNVPSLRTFAVPRLYVPVATAKEPPPPPFQRSEPPQSSRNGSANSEQLSGFLVSELENQILRSSLDNSIKNFATSFTRDNRVVVNDVVKNLEQQLSSPGTAKKYSILAAAMAAGFLMTRGSG
jgi:hypothetical protein